MKSLSAAQAQQLDQWAIETIGIPSVVLMENAGRFMADEVIKKLRRVSKSSVAIVCGVGNIGGDGLVTARHLWTRGINPRVFLLGGPSQLKPDSHLNYQIIRNLGVKVDSIYGINPSFKKAIRCADMVVDAIFGVGLNRRIQEPYHSIIEAINAAARYTMAMDVPSGLDATTGEIYGACIKAKVTVTFNSPKKGFFEEQGPYYVGKCIVANIGIPVKHLKPLLQK